MTARRLHGGIENDVFAVDLGGEMRVVRRSAAATLSSVEREMEMLTELGGQLNSVVLPLPARFADGRLLTVVDRQPVVSLSYVEGYTPRELTPQLIEEICHFFASFHAVGSRGSWRSTDSDRSTLDFALWCGLNSSSAGPRGFEAEAARVAERISKMATDLEPLLSRGAPTLIHGDITAGNVIVNHSGTLTGVIDFADGWIDSELVDYGFLGRSVMSERVAPLEKLQHLQNLVSERFGTSTDEFLRIVQFCCGRQFIVLASRCDESAEVANAAARDLRSFELLEVL